MGEVENVGGAAAGFPKVTATAYDADGAVVATDFDYLDLDPLPPGLKIGYKLQLDTSTAPTTYKVKAEAQRAHTQLLPVGTLVVVPQSNETDSLGDIHTYGEVHNTGQGSAYSVTVAGTYFDIDGNVLDICEDSIAIILPDEKYPFECRTFFHEISPTSAHFVVTGRAGPGSFLPSVRLDVPDFVYYEEPYSASVDGVIVNPNGKPVSSPRVVIAAYDPEGRVVARDSTYGFQAIAPGSHTWFHNSLFEAPPGSTLKVFADGNEVSSITSTSLTLQNLSNQTKSYGSPYLVGEVLNGGSVEVSSFKVSAAWFDGDGKIVAAASTSEYTTIRPGDSAPFELTYPRDIGNAQLSLAVSS